MADSATSVADIHIIASPPPSGAPGVWDKTGSFGPPAGSENIPTALIAQGNVVVDAVDNLAPIPGETKYCAGQSAAERTSTVVRAAIIAETGTLTLPPKWRSEIRQQETPKSGQFAL